MSEDQRPPEQPEPIRVGDLELLRELGRGGMGIVYEARQLSLDRRVAVKVLTEESYGDERLHARFLREARTAAAINHPNICTIHEVGEVRPGEEPTLPDGVRIKAGTPFISMELIEGSSLAAKLRESNALPLEELLRIADHVAEGLAEAHATGIVHRDLKPGNVMLTRTGHAKILDFGLAKPVGPAPEGDEVLTAAETVSAELTREGRVLGTVAYMSPEQAQGRAVDSRSDVFSFGIMLYEMATGQRPFQGESPTSTLAKILEAEPEPVNVRRSDLPPELVRIVQRCLRKRPEDRYNDTRDLAVALRDLRDETTSGATRKAAATSTRKATWLRGAVVVAVVIVLVSMAIWYASRSPTPVAPGTTHRQITFTGRASQPTLSPDGKSVAYVSRDVEDVERVLVQDLAGGEPLEIFRGRTIMELQWSPNGDELLLAADADDEGYYAQIVPRLGGTPRRHPVSDLSQICWAPDGSHIAGISFKGDSIRFIDLKTGKTESVALDKSYEWVRDLDWSSSGEWLAFSTVDQTGRGAIWTVRPDGAMQQKVLEGEFIDDLGWHPQRDAILYMEVKGQTYGLGIIPIDPRTGSRRGEPRPILPGVEAGIFSVSGDGSHLVYERGSAFRNLWLVDFTGEPPKGRAEVTQLTAGTLMNWQAKFSPDGRGIAFHRGRGLDGNVFVLSLESRTERQLTFLGTVGWSLAWSPDGKAIAFYYSMDGQTVSLWRVAAEGGAPQQFEGTVKGLGLGLEWAPGKRIIHTTVENTNFYLFDPETGEDTPLLPEDSGWVGLARYSRDGERIALMWNRTTGEEAIRGRGLWVFSIDGSSEHLVCKGSLFIVGWSDDDEWIYAIQGELDAESGEIDDPRLVRIPAGGGEPEPWFEIPFERVSWAGFDITPDGRRFLGSRLELVSDIWVAENFDRNSR